jgi:hypothetical protein
VTVSLRSAVRKPIAGALVAVLALAAALALPIRSADAAVVSSGASTAHPFSDPVWWPLSTETKTDCYSGNPGCTSPRYHTEWLMDPVSTNRSVAGPTAHEPVFAMGAGIVHYGVSRDVGCGQAHGRGNFLWIDHGNGTLSWYGHLAWPFKAKNGQYVTARTQIAEIGNSGYSNCRTFPTLHYIDIAVERGATNGLNNGTYVQLSQLKACVGGQVQSWPRDLPQNRGAWKKWNDVPRSQRGNEIIIPASDRSRSCIPATPRTPNRATSVRLVKAGSGALRASWARPTSGPAPSSIVVNMQEYHPSIHRWLDLRKHTLPAAQRSTVFGKLHLKHTFRVTVTFRNSVGYSARSAYVSRKAT